MVRRRGFTVSGKAHSPARVLSRQFCHYSKKQTQVRRRFETMQLSSIAEGWWRIICVSLDSIACKEQRAPTHVRTMYLVRFLCGPRSPSMQPRTSKYGYIYSLPLGTGKNCPSKPPKHLKKPTARRTCFSSSVSNAKVVAGGVRKRWESPLPEPVELGLESLDLSCLGPGEVNEAAPCGDALHSPSGLVGKGVHVQGT